MNDSPSIPAHIRQVIEAACEGAGVSLIDLGVRGQHRQLRMEIAIDAPSGITHEHCRAVSRSLDDQLHEDEWYGRFRAVEVSSPGAETPVRFLWQLTKHIGRTVYVETTDGAVLEGTLLRADDTGLDVQPKNKGRSKTIAETVTITADTVKSAHMVISL